MPGDEDEDTDEISARETRAFRRALMSWQQEQRKKKLEDLEEENPEFLFSWGSESSRGEIALDLALQRLGAASGQSPSIEDRDQIDVVERKSHVSNPFAPVRAIEDTLASSETTEIRGLWPTDGALYQDPVGRMLDSGTKSEFVFSEGALDALRDEDQSVVEVEPTSEEWLVSQLDSDQCEVYVTPDLGFELFILDDRVLIGLIPYHEDENSVNEGIHDICIRGSDPGLRKWADEVFKTIRERAQDVEHFPQTV